MTEFSTKPSWEEGTRVRESTSVGIVRSLHYFFVCVPGGMGTSSLALPVKEQHVVFLTDMNTLGLSER